MRTAENLDTHDATGTAVIGNLKHRFGLNHFSLQTPKMGAPSRGREMLTEVACRSKPKHQMAPAFSITSTSSQVLVLDTGRHSLIETVSPSWHWFSSS